MAPIYSDGVIPPLKNEHRVLPKKKQKKKSSHQHISSFCLSSRPPIRLICRTKVFSLLLNPDSGHLGHSAQEGKYLVGVGFD